MGDHHGCTRLAHLLSHEFGEDDKRDACEKRHKGGENGHTEGPGEVVEVGVRHPVVVVVGHDAEDEARRDHTDSCNGKGRDVEIF